MGKCLRKADPLGLPRRVVPDMAERNVAASAFSSGDSVSAKDKESASPGAILAASCGGLGNVRPCAGERFASPRGKRRLSRRRKGFSPARAYRFLTTHSHKSPCGDLREPLCRRRGFRLIHEVLPLRQTVCLTKEVIYKRLLETESEVARRPAQRLFGGSTTGPEGPRGA